jgi:hypothetical protein
MALEVGSFEATLTAIMTGWAGPTLARRFRNRQSDGLDRLPGIVIELNALAGHELSLFQPRSEHGDRRLGAPRHPRERVRGDKYPAMVIERSLSVECLTGNVFD